MTEIEKEINKLDNIAKLYFDKGEYTEAIECFDKILAIDPNDIFSLNKKGLALSNLGKDSEAIQYYDKALAINPNHITFLNNKGIALDNLGKYTEAIECYDKILEIDPNYVDVLNNKGVALDNLGKYNQAIECYDKTLAINPNHINALSNKGVTLEKLSKSNQAIECYDKALAIDLNHINALNNKGVALGNLGKDNEAIQYYDKVLAINPNHIKALNNKGKALLYISSDIDAKECAECFVKGGNTPLLILNKFKVDKRANIIRLIKVIMYMIEQDTFFKSATENKGSTTQYRKIYFQTLQIVSFLHVTGQKIEDKDFSQELKVAHYTRKDVSYDLLLKEENKERSPLRLFTIATGNDPKEGETLFDHLQISNSNANGNIKNDYYQAFIACFTFNKQSLNQFRLYGKEQQREATGVSLVVDNDYFNTKIGFNSSVFSTIKTISDDLSAEPENRISEEEKLSLFRCIYIDPQTHQIVSIGHKEEYEIYRDSLDIKETDTPKEIENKEKALRKKIKSYSKLINTQLEKVRKQLNKLNKYIYNNKKSLDMQVVKELLIMLRYLVKHVAFKEEQECRILRIEKIDSEKIISEDRNRMYIKHLPIDNYVNSIYVGSQASDAKLYRDIIRHECKDIDVYICDHPFFSK